MYHDLMNLYGDWANVAALKRAFSERGHSVIVDKKSVGDDVDFCAYELVYIGSGTERSQRVCMNDLERYRDTLAGYIEDGMHVLATGNSHELFGRTIKGAFGEPYEALGLLDFETVQENSRTVGDCVCKASFLQEKLIGFINRAGGRQEGDIERPFLLELGPGVNNKPMAEGIRYKNLLGTYMTGPILVRNPPLLRCIADMLTGDSASTENVAPVETISTTPHSTLHTALLPSCDPFFLYQDRAYRLALQELSARIPRSS